MNKNQRMNRMGVLLMIWAAACLNSHAQQDSAKVLSNSKEEGNRNVMLNAASANGPREISIGLPGGDVNVLENGLPRPRRRCSNSSTEGGSRNTVVAPGNQTKGSFAT